MGWLTEMSDAINQLSDPGRIARREIATQEPFCVNGIFYFGAWMKWRDEGGKPEDFLPPEAKVNPTAGG